MKNLPLDFIAVFHIAETAARVLSEERPSKNPNPAPDLITIESHSRCRSMMRRSAVETLRMLWRTGDPETRITVASRVHVWCRDQVLPRTIEEISARERNRKPRRGTKRLAIAA